MTKIFWVVDDYTDCSIWDDLIFEKILELSSKPKNWEAREENTLPEGDWMLGHGIHQHATAKEFVTIGIPHISFEQLPAVFCVTDEGIIGKYKVRTADQALEFIKSNL